MFFSTALVFIILQISLGTSHSLKNKRPNIVVFIADDLGSNDISIRGSNEIFTPNIDALALNGILLNKHYTQQSCTPSRAAFLTGQYPIRFGYQGIPITPGGNKSIPHDLWTWPKGLRELGYSTHLLGKWHLGSGKREWTPEGYGYDSHFGYWNGFIGYFNHKIREHSFKYRGTPPSCKDICLFDLTDDPCETTDLSAQLPEITEELLKNLKRYEKELVPQIGNYFNPASNPKFCYGNWFNYLDEGGCLI